MELLKNLKPIIIVITVLISIIEILDLRTKIKNHWKSREGENPNTFIPVLITIVLYSILFFTIYYY